MGQDIHPKLNLPVSDFAVRKRDSKDEIFDTIRKQWLVLTPEEGELLQSFPVPGAQNILGISVHGGHAFAADPTAGPQV